MTRLLAGTSLKPEFFEDAIGCADPGFWFEVHPENYMVGGGQRLAWLDRFAKRHPLSFHSVSLSLASLQGPDPEHLARLRYLVDRFHPVLVSDHLAWSTGQGAYHPDLLPFQRTRQALRAVVSNIQRVQEALGRTIAIENPSHYLAIEGHEFTETMFLEEVADRAGCGLLLDVNNVFVSAANLGFDASSYLRAFPARHVTEIHLAGHAPDPSHGESLLIDSHSTRIDEAVWSLYAELIADIGPKPTLIERDQALPTFRVLAAEAARARKAMTEIETRKDGA